MTLNRVKLGRTFMKYFASLVSLTFLKEALIWGLKEPKSRNFL